MSWTKPQDIRGAVQRRWDRGHLLVPPDELPIFPLQIRFSRPNPQALLQCFEEVRSWIQDLNAHCKQNTRFGYEIQWGDINHRQLGGNRIPMGATVPTLDDALALIGKRREAERFQALRDLTQARLPTLNVWVARNPLKVLQHADNWKKLLDVVDWFVANPRPNIYLRQVEIAGVDTKFIETNRALLAALLDEALPGESVTREASPMRQFEFRYGLRGKPALVRFRILDERLAVGGMTDIAVPGGDFARLDLNVRTVFITENEINGLAFPPTPDSLVIFGLGYGLNRLARTPWLANKSLFYWGDIDTHGFAMLDHLRAGLPHAQSLLMDRETLMAHQSSWVHEEVPYDRVVTRLTSDEKHLFDELVANGLGQSIRLEQERIGYAWILRALAALR